MVNLILDYQYIPPEACCIVPGTGPWKIIKEGVVKESANSPEEAIRKAQGIYRNATIEYNDYAMKKRHELEKK